MQSSITLNRKKKIFFRLDYIYILLTFFEVIPFGTSKDNKMLENF